MNYDLNDGIPPYDLPIEGSQNGDSENLTGQGYPSAQEGDSGDYANAPVDSNPVSDNAEINDEYIQDEVPAKPVQKKSSNLSALVVILLLTLILGGALLFIYGPDSIFSNLSFMKKKDTASQTIIDEENTSGGELPSDEILNNADETNLSANDTSENVDIDVLKERHNRVMQGEQNSMTIPLDDNTMSIPNNPDVPNASKNEILADIRTIIPRGNVGRLYPFNPTGGSSQMVDLIMPPVNPEPDPEVQQLMTLKISGIMYTPDSPSAIINIAGSDQLVRKGDKFNGFSVEGISKDKVTVRNGKNTYTASIGETLDIEAVGINAIPNLNKKFAGPYTKNAGKIIEINTLN